MHPFRLPPYRLILNEFVQFSLYDVQNGRNEEHKNDH